MTAVPVVSATLTTRTDEPQICSVEGCGISKTRLRRGMCQKHYTRWRNSGSTDKPNRRTPELERFMARVIKTDDGCWLWTGKLSVRGYGRFKTGDRRDVLAHRWSYEHHIGPIPDEMVLDHICHQPDDCDGGDTCPHRACVNPEHVVVTTLAANAGRQHHRNAYATHCKRGHEFTPETTRLSPDGHRRCRVCINEKKRAKNASVPDGVLSWIELAS